MKLNLNEIYEFAKNKHNGQFRRDGITPYFEHCEKVASLCDTDFLKAVAYCHDLIEDNRCTQEELLNIAGRDVLTYCMMLTHSKNMTYNEYIQGIRNSFSRQIISIKIADIISNLTDNPTEKQIVKYKNALEILCNINKFF